VSLLSSSPLLSPVSVLSVSPVRVGDGAGLCECRCRYFSVSVFFLGYVRSFRNFSFLGLTNIYDFLSLCLSLCVCQFVCVLVCVSVGVVGVVLS